MSLHKQGNKTAKSLRLYEWHTGVTLAPLVLPVRINESPEQAAQRYLNCLSQNSCLMRLFENKIPDLPFKQFTEISENLWDPRALMIANLPYDYSLESPRILGFQNVLSRHQEQGFILPINANLGLDYQETQELFELIASHFAFMIAMGGDDVDPSLYRQINSHCRKTTPTRDQFEADLIKFYVQAEKGFLLGVCRGSQIASVALGYELIQDVAAQIGDIISHDNEWHPIEIQNTQHNILKSVDPEKDQLIVNSIHHQAVIYREGGPLQIAAIASDGVTEATEFRNGRGLLLQFHPELMNNPLGEEIIKTALMQKKRLLK